MIVAGEIVLRWNNLGQLQVVAPMSDKLLCCMMLCEAQRAILNHIPGLVLPRNAPPPDIHSKN